MRWTECKWVEHQMQGVMIIIVEITIQLKGGLEEAMEVNFCEWAANGTFFAHADFNYITSIK